MAHVAIVGHVGRSKPLAMNCIKGQKMKIGSIGLAHGDIVRVLKIGQSVLIVELLDNPRIAPYPIFPDDFSVFWI